MRFNYGAGNRERLHSAFRYGTALVTGMMILGTLAVILFPAQILGLFTGVGSHALLWNLRYADYGGKLSVLRPFYHDFNLFSSDGKNNFQYVDSTVAAASPAHSIHVVLGKAPEDYRDLAVLSCRRSDNICSGVPAFSGRQEKRSTLRRYKVTVIIRKERQYGNTD